MEALAPKYRVSTTRAVSKEEVFSRFKAEVESSALHENVWHCKDGSVLVFKASPTEEMFYVELKCQFHALPGKNISFGLLPTMIRLCAVNGGNIKIIRNNSVIPASEGAVLSDVFHSRSHRIVEHLAICQNDLQARRHFEKEKSS